MAREECLPGKPPDGGPGTGPRLLSAARRVLIALLARRWYPPAQLWPLCVALTMPASPTPSGKPGPISTPSDAPWLFYTASAFGLTFFSRSSFISPYAIDALLLLSSCKRIR